jgi:hypothetical protein
MVLCDDGVERLVVGIGGDDPPLERSRQFTSLWIGATAKVRLAVVPLSSGACARTLL